MQAFGEEGTSSLLIPPEGPAWHKDIAILGPPGGASNICELGEYLGESPTTWVLGVLEAGASHLHCT
jgi:hypothetical protein